MQRDEAQKTPRQHAQWIAHLIREAQYECRADIGRDVFEANEEVNDYFSMSATA